MFFFPYGGMQRVLKWFVFCEISKVSKYFRFFPVFLADLGKKMENLEKVVV